MSEHIERMKVEHRELKEKIDSLNAFIYGNDLFKTLCPIEQARMIKQGCFMECYLTMLHSRIWVAS